VRIIFLNKISTSPSSFLIFIFWWATKTSLGPSCFPTTIKQEQEDTRRISQFFTDCPLWYTADGQKSEMCDRDWGTNRDRGLLVNFVWICQLGNVHRGFRPRFPISATVLTQSAPYFTNNRYSLSEWSENLWDAFFTFWPLRKTGLISTPPWFIR